MEVNITKGRGHDLIAIRRGDGTVEETTFPKKGLFPHDAIHLVVEAELQYETGFWGRVAAGCKPEDIGAIAIAGGHRSSSRAEVPSEEIVELIQAERIVECFEAEMWSQPSDLDTFKEVLRAACSQSHVEPPNLKNENIRNIRDRLEELVSQWQDLKVGQTLSITWP
ncbi:MAG: hypothetical protein AAGE43_05870 [Pseudomonadota bacterium]